MKICRVCKAECEDNAELCPICGADLTVTVEEAEEEKIISKPVLLAILEDVVSSEILQDLLKENGIPFSCDSDNEGTLKVSFGGSFSSDEIYVDEGDFERANQIYEDFLNSEPEFDEEFFEEAAALGFEQTDAEEETEDAAETENSDE